MDKTDSKPVSDKELEEESDIEEVIEKDGAGYGDLQSLNAQPDETNRDAETYVGRPAPVKSETYIQERKSYSMGMTDQNKLKNTKIGDHINYYDNGISGNGVVTKMSGQFIQIFKDDGQFYNLNINDTFHVSDILINKTWDDMDLAERTDELMKIKAYSPRFLSKTWDQLPRELKDVMKKEDWDKNERDNEKRSRGGESLPDEDSPFSDHQEALHHQGSNRGERGEGLGGSRIDPKKQTFAQDQKEFGKIYDMQAENNPKLKSRITKAEWDLMKDTDHDELTAARSSKRETQDYDDDSSISFGNDDPVDTGYKPKRKRKITKAEWDSMKSSIEDGALGNTGSSPTTGVSTKIPFDAPKDYEGQTHATKNPDREFQYEDEKPEVGNEPKAPEVKLDEQGLIKANPSFVYSDNPQGYKLPPQPKQKGYGMRYGVKYINEEEDN